VAPDAVALRELMPRDLIRAQDVGAATEVMAGAPVQVVVVAGSVSVVAQGTALDDAHTGDTVDVRLQRPSRIVKARVTGPGSTELVGVTP